VDMKMKIVFMGLIQNQV